MVDGQLTKLTIATRAIGGPKGKAVKERPERPARAAKPLKSYIASDDISGSCLSFNFSLRADRPIALYR